MACPIVLASLLPSCAALTSPAGVRDFHYAVRKSDIASLTLTAGALTALTLVTGALFIKVQGRKFQNSGSSDLAKSATGKSRFKHTFNARIFHRTQAERTTIENLALVEDLVIFSPNNDNQIEVYGLNNGLAPSAGKGGTGVKLEDDNTFSFTFDGDEPKMPALFNTVTTPTTDEADQITNLAYLDDLVSG